MTLLGTGGAWRYLHAIDDGFTHIDALDPDSADVVDPGGQRGDETFLIVGTDSRAGATERWAPVTPPTSRVPAPTPSC